MNPANVAILVMDRANRFLEGISRVLKDAGYQVRTATTERAARGLTAREHFNIIIKAFDPRGADRFAVMDALRRESPDTQFIFVSEGGSIRTAMEAIHHGAFDYLSWPAENEHILRSVRQALEHQAVVADDPEIRKRLKRRADVDIFVGESAGMREVQEIVRQVAPTDVSVLIQGESGTGKEIVARAIHERSHRQDGPFVAVNCAALPETLIESEFFGHVRGAFTGAIADKAGRFELARGGTLFLDEIGDLSRLGQADLLRVLEDGVFRPIGSRTVVRHNARIVAATNRDLEALCASGGFREDLLYRLNVITITLPPLRERPEDVPLLVEMFRRHFAMRHGRPRKRFRPEAIRAMQAFSWPGNVRQLRNIVERLVLVTPSAEIGVEDLPPAVREGPPPAAEPVGGTLAEREEAWIRETLARVDGNRTRAAERLGISRRTLQYKLQKIERRKREGGGAARDGRR
jgi:Response regulator containing CheY-like receiver, AAA-type ATPase, and DNA-binding domains